MTDTAPLPTAIRGPAEHAVRDQIVEAANECFARYGYAKTTVADLAREIGFSKAYIYRFFDSKQAIGEAICSSRLDRIVAETRSAIDAGGSETDRFRRMFKSLTTLSVDLFFQDRKIYDIAAHSAAEHWASAIAYCESLRAMIVEIVRAGRESGEFERKTPLDETCRAIFYAMMPFVDPLHLERNLDLLPDAQLEVCSLILRSLAP
ncbi:MULTISPECIES: TetR/AcrR family transcriptional regulator [unclassified Sphingomonas]|uniref:TetR/AcrR family transcriptional regulator n=1 Tax=unclassified Sphingomonas TaxID=196159 RepID=UPI0006FE1F15|nr:MULTISPECIES: TetR/AcrR family transcriptional regulator [unclassified Sphingomonas]KQM62655.1 AcrR family transcriptional regulator [Sphingomonas sp. Leaf16]KQN14906.1 AcrR family transcriptional regulator [Sphingomonas sp. Leaf29]KQN20439.1 AcrR family transcriptional regulator [Sphingomonas sp. Leaf32]